MTSDNPALLDWLTAQIAEDERRITGCCHCGNPIRQVGGEFTHGDWPGEDWQGRRCPRRITGALPNPEPDQARREVEFKRAILARHDSDGFPCCTYCGENAPCPDLRDLAAVYADRPGYQEATGG